MIRTVKQVNNRNIKEMCIEANYYLSRDMDAAMKMRLQRKNLN